MKKELVLGIAMLLMVPLGVIEAKRTHQDSEPDVVQRYGPLNVYDPILSNPRATYYYDIRNKKHIVGGEKVLLGWYGLEGFFSLGTDLIHPRGCNPVLGVNLPLPNPLPAWVGWDAFHPSLTAGYNFQTEKPTVALKAGVTF